MSLLTYWICPNCGYNITRQKCVVCPKCGTRKPEQAESQKAPGKKQDPAATAKAMRPHTTREPAGEKNSRAAGSTGNGKPSGVKTEKEAKVPAASGTPLFGKPEGTSSRKEDRIPENIDFRADLEDNGEKKEKEKSLDSMSAAELVEKAAEYGISLDDGIDPSIFDVNAPAYPGEPVPEDTSVDLSGWKQGMPGYTAAQEYREEEEEADTDDPGEITAGSLDSIEDISLESLLSGEKKKRYDPNHDGFYDDVKPEIDDVENKFPVDLVVKIVVSCIIVVAALFYLVYSLV